MKLNETKFRTFLPGQIRPLGWLRRQLETEADGLVGNLDKVWPDVRDSKWIGGNREGWERVPYWLDGFIPLACLLERDDLMNRAKRYVDAILNSQCEDGWICPCEKDERSHYDMWALFLLGKVLVLYAECTGDSRIEPALMKAFHQYNDHIDANTIYGWASARWYEALIPIFWLYEKTGATWLLELADKLDMEGFDYEKLIAHYHDEIPVHKWTFTTHVVNLAMCLKAGALTSRLHGTNGDAYAEKILETLMKHHSMAVGLFTGDEQTAGDSPIQGAELCSVVEAMYSYETLMLCGNAHWADMTEKLAFNALPATISPDMWTHQYVQQTNQVQCTVISNKNQPFTTNSGDAHTFGLEPHYGCCTANMGQGWPKVALHAFLSDGNGIVSSLLVPAKVETEIQNTRVTCTLETDYPFRNELVYHIVCEKPIEFPFTLRIPEYVQSAEINGKAVETGYHQIQRLWLTENEIHVRLNYTPQVVARPGSMQCVWNGPLLYALPVDEKWIMHEYERGGVERKFPYCDYEIIPCSDWNYGFASDCFVPCDGKFAEKSPFTPECPPCILKTKLSKIEWNLKNGCCTPKPESVNPIGQPEEKILIPYGCTNLRMTEMPRIPRI